MHRAQTSDDEQQTHHGRGKQALRRTQRHVRQHYAHVRPDIHNVFTACSSAAAAGCVRACVRARTCVCVCVRKGSGGSVRLSPIHISFGTTRETFAIILRPALLPHGAIRAPPRTDGKDTAALRFCVRDGRFCARVWSARAYAECLFIFGIKSTYLFSGPVARRQNHSHQRTHTHLPMHDDSVMRRSHIHTHARARTLVRIVGGTHMGGTRALILICSNCK